MTFHLSYPIAKLNPAPYNPRKIDDQSILRLRASIRTLGLIKPVIATDTGTLLAGHQRTKSMLAEGLTHCPVFMLKDVSEQDEIRFNQLHNASDLELGIEPLYIPPQASTGFVDVPYEDIKGPLIAKYASKRNEILRLLAKHGEWGSAVATQSGEVLVSRLYANACRVMSMPCKFYIVPDDMKELVMSFFGQSYGKFSYDHFEKTTWCQAFVQPYRLRENKHGNMQLHSYLYEGVAMPRMKKEMRIIDFGAGQMDYVKMLSKQGYDIRGMEFYYRREGHVAVSAVHRLIDRVCEDLRTYGRYDMVVCDSVLNSVDSLQAEFDVMSCIHALVKPGGIACFSGRGRYNEEDRETNTSSHIYNKNRLNFIDEDGFTAMYSQGIWRYQKYYYARDVHRIVKQHFPDTPYTIYGDGKKVAHDQEVKSTAWQVSLTKKHDRDADDVIPSLRREFDLPLPGKRSYKRSDDIEAAYRAALEVEKRTGQV